MAETAGSAINQPSTAGHASGKRIQIDDAYLGGEVRGGMAGRGSPNKVPFVAAVQTTEFGKAVPMCLSQRACTKESIREFTRRSVAATAILVSDGLGSGSICARSSGDSHRPPARPHRVRSVAFG